MDCAPGERVGSPPAERAVAEALETRVRSLVAETPTGARLDLSIATTPVRVRVQVVFRPSVEVFLCDEPGPSGTHGSRRSVRAEIEAREIAGKPLDKLVEKRRARCEAAAVARADSWELRGEAQRVLEKNPLSFVPSSARHTLLRRDGAFSYEDICKDCKGEGRRRHSGEENATRCRTCSGSGTLTTHYGYEIGIGREISVGITDGTPEMVSSVEAWIGNALLDELAALAAPGAQSLEPLEGHKGYFAFAFSLAFTHARASGHLGSDAIDSEMLGMPLVYERHAPFVAPSIEALASRVRGVRDAGGKPEELFELARKSALGAELAEVSLVGDANAVLAMSATLASRKGALTEKAAWKLVAPLRDAKLTAARRIEAVAWPLAAVASLAYSTVLFASNVLGYDAVRTGGGLLLGMAAAFIGMAPALVAMVIVGRSLRRRLGAKARAPLGRVGLACILAMLGSVLAVVALPMYPPAWKPVFEASGAVAAAIGIDGKQIRDAVSGDFSVEAR
jgi:hypothetical protein